MAEPIRHAPHPPIHGGPANPLPSGTGVGCEPAGVDVAPARVAPLPPDIDTPREPATAPVRAQSVPGVAAHADTIVDDRASSRTSDIEIGESAPRELPHHDQPPGQSIDVSVTRPGTLRGTANRQPDRTTAPRLTLTMSDTSTVIDNTDQPPALSDADTRSRIEDTLGRIREVDAEHIKVRVEDHVVTLRGHVRCWSENQVIERAAWSAPGVAHVRNHLVIAY